MNTLYIVATPIGNLEDISARAIRILKEVDMIAAEDTRRTAKLLNHFEITTPTTSYYEHNELNKVDKIIAMLNKGDVALVSDAGTPGMNDPGYLLVRAALDEGYNVSPIPGPSAPVAALVASGLPTDRFLYLGYLPRKSGERRSNLLEVADLPYTLVYLEAPHRISNSLEDIENVLGNRRIAVCEELTKMYESIFRGRVSEALDHFAAQTARGEFTLVIAGAEKKVEAWEINTLMTVLKAELATGRPPSMIAKEVSLKCGWPRRKVYDLLTSLIQERK